jgi:hypothetical protein
MVTPSSENLGKAYGFFLSCTLSGIFESPSPPQNKLRRGGGKDDCLERRRNIGSALISNLSFGSFLSGADPKPCLTPRIHFNDKS